MSTVPASARPAPPADNATFGEFLKYLRRRARLTQDELGRAVGYSREQINRIERNQRLPDALTLASLFVPALDLRDSPELVARFLELAARTRGETLPSSFQVTHTLERRVTLPAPLRAPRARPRSTKSELDAHRAAAEWAELAQGDVIQAAHEYGLAGDYQHAAEVLAGQGALLFNQGKHEAAAGVIDELLDDLRRRGLAARYPDVTRILLTTRGDLLLNTTRADEAEANYREAMQLAQGAVRATLVYHLSTALSQRGRAAEALALVQETLSQLAPAHRLLRAQLKMVEGGALMMLSRFDQAEQANLQALALAEELTPAMPYPAASVRARANNALGAINAIRGNRAQALAYWQAAVATAQLAGLRQLEYRAHGNIANVLYEEGELEAAARACNTALDGLKSIGDMQGASKFIHLRANLYFLRGEIQESLALTQDAAALKLQVGDRHSYLGSVHQQVKALIVLGQLAEAQALSTASLLELEQLGDERTRGYWLATLSEIELLQGHAERARAHLEAALQLPGAAADAKLRRDCANHLAVVALVEGALGGAAGQLADQADATLEMSLEHDLICGLFQWAQGEREQAKQTLEQVRLRGTERGYLLAARRAKMMTDALTGEWEPNKAPQLLYGEI